MVGILVTTLISPSQAANENRQFVRLSDPKKPAKIKINLIDGDLNISSHDKPAVEILAISKKKNSSIAISTNEDDNVVHIRVAPRSNVDDLQINVPVNSSLDVDVINGNVKVSRVKGELEVTVKDGHIKLDQISGHVMANTVDGNITLELIEATPGKPMSLSTVDGDILLSLPKKVKATVNASTVDGRIQLEHPTGTVSSSQQLSGLSNQTILFNAGGSKYQLSTINGDILIQAGKPSPK